MPKVEDIFSKLNGTKYFSTLDLQAGYHHIPLNDASIPKTAFTSCFGKYGYLKIPFWLAQAPAYFQELMIRLLKDLPFTISYLDDIIIYSKTTEDYMDHLKQVFHKLRNAKLSMKLNKCHFFTKETQYLGHILRTTDIKPLPSKTKAIKGMQPPWNGKQVWGFLGLIWYYWKFIRNFACIAKPLMTLTWPDGKFAWTTNPPNSILKEALIQALILHYLDPSKCYIVYTDASDNAYRAQLSQEHSSQELPVIFSLHTFMEIQHKWSTPK